jgi:hypothetical protein
MALKEITQASPAFVLMAIDVVNKKSVLPAYTTSTPTDSLHLTKDSSVAYPPTLPSMDHWPIKL